MTDKQEMTAKQRHFDDGVREAVKKWEETLAAIYAVETHKPGPPTREWRKEHIEEIRLFLSRELNPADGLELFEAIQAPKKSWLPANPHLSRAPVVYMAFVVYMVTILHDSFVGLWSSYPCDSVASCGVFALLWFAGVTLLFVSVYFGIWFLFDIWLKAREVCGRFLSDRHRPKKSEKLTNLIQHV
jgi:hypothetical protein